MTCTCHVHAHAHVHVAFCIWRVPTVVLVVLLPDPAMSCSYLAASGRRAAGLLSSCCISSSVSMQRPARETVHGLSGRARLSRPSAGAGVARMTPARRDVALSTEACSVCASAPWLQRRLVSMSQPHSMSPDGLRDRRVADRVLTSADRAEEDRAEEGSARSDQGLKEGLASVSRPFFDGSQVLLHPAVIVP